MRDISAPLLSWYDQNKRPLPWRDQGSAYLTWVSEIMLQQTRIETVKPYFARFIKELPDLRSLAECSDEKLLKLWEGLGYYSRVRNMKAAAQDACARFGGELPHTKAELLTLKGIGEYTASAIASIAYGEKAATVDGNVLRILSRLTLCEEDISKASVKKAFTATLEEIIPPGRPGDFNQALMELGEVICLPNAQPLCLICPLYKDCLAGQEGRGEDYPKKAPKKPRRVEERTILILRREEECVLQRRPNKGLLAGLYEPPSLSGSLTAEEALEAVRSLGLIPEGAWPLPASRHLFSHVEWVMSAYLIPFSVPEEGAPASLILARPQDLQGQYPLPSAFSAYRSYLEKSADP